MLAFLREELIDTQWDVNILKIKTVFKNIFELIDTQWDVNDHTKYSVLSVISELIDTQWDVNDYVSEEQKDFIRN